MSWSSGKDAAWALHTVRRDSSIEVAGLLTTFNAEFDRVSMQGVRRELVDAQARSIGVPVWSVDLPWPCPNDVYEDRMARVIARAVDQGISAVIFGDLYLEDVRAYREEQMSETGVEPLFPIWADPTSTRSLAESMLDSGVRAIITAVDTTQLDATFAGRAFDERFLDDLPAAVDPLGENGEFHTFCFAGPAFSAPIDCRVGDVVDRGRFVYADVTLSRPG